VLVTPSGVVMPLHKVDSFDEKTLSAVTDADESEED